MKNLLRTLVAVFINLVLFSCDSNETASPIQPEQLSFDSSVVLLQYGKDIQAKTNPSEKQVLMIEIKNFNPNLNLKTEYYIDGVQYTDDGQFNDLDSGDGVFTSIETFSSTDEKVNQEFDRINLGEEFKYDDELKAFLKEKYSKLSSNSALNGRGGSIKFGCKTRLITCPETSWWDSCWPLSSPCTCVEFYDCEASIEIDF